MLAVLPLCLALILLATPSANAGSYAASEESSYFGNLVQPYPFNSSNPYVCAQTSLVNAFVYLQNAYPGTYGMSLVPSSMDAVARNLNNNNRYLPTTWSDSDGRVGYGTFAWGTYHYVQDQGQLPNTYFYAETTYMSSWGVNSWVTSAPSHATGIAENPTWGFLYNGLLNGDAVVIGWTSESGQGHYMTLTAINFDSSTGEATITYIDPKDGTLYTVPIYGNSDGTIGFFYSNRTHPWYTGDVAVKMALVFGPTPLSSMDPPGLPPLHTVADYFDTVQEIYIGYYQRPGDPGGLIYWANRLFNSGGNLSEIIEAYANSAEAQALYGTINSSNISTVVNGIYRALFGRDAEAEGLNYYVNGFNLGQFTAATIMLNVLYGAQNEDLQSVNNKVTAANLFTWTIDPDLNGANFQATYSGDTDAQKARNFLSTVGWDPATILTQAEVTLFIKNNIADPGDPILNP
jgi:hypothetical protein